MTVKPRSANAASCCRVIPESVMSVPMTDASPSVANAVRPILLESATTHGAGRAPGHERVDARLTLVVHARADHWVDAVHADEGDVQRDLGEDDVAERAGQFVAARMHHAAGDTVLMCGRSAS